MHKVPLLLGAQCSRYSARVRSYLIKKGIQYVERVPSLVTYKWTVARRFGDAQMPILINRDGEWIHDSSNILDRMEAMHPADPILPSDPVLSVFCQLAAIWGAESWVVYDLAARWIHPENYPWWQEELGEGFFPGLPKALKNRAADHVAKMITSHLPKVGYDDKSWPVIERWASRYMDILEAHFEKHDYLLGARATSADFGLICGFYGHLAQDPWSRRNLLQMRPHLHAWIWRMNQPYLGAEVPPLPAAGRPLTPSLQPIVASLFDDLLPYLEGTLSELHRQFPAPRPGLRAPRFLGMIKHHFGDGEIAWQAQAIVLLQLQRVRDFIAGLSAQQASNVRDWLHANGGASLLELDVPRLELSGLTVKFV